MDASLTFKTIDLDETEEQAVSGPCRMTGFHVMNQHATDKRYVHFYDALIADVTVGTTTPKLTYVVLAGTERTFTLPGGIRFDVGIAAAATTAITGNGAPAANDVVLNVMYLSP